MDDEIPQSDEVMQEGQDRFAAMEEMQRAAEEEAAAHIQAMKDDHNQRVDAAEKFDWQAWEDETGLERPNIPPRL